MARLRQRLAIILVNFNQERDILECLASLYRSDFQPLHVIVSDNGSTDGSISAIRRNYPQVTIIENGKNLGFAEANNRAVKALGTGDFEYFLFLNSDTVVPRDFLARLMKEASTFAFDISGPKVLYHELPDTIWFAGGYFIPARCTFYHRHQNMKDDGIVESIPCDFVTGCALLIKREIFLQLNGFDGDYFLYCEDLDLCMRARMSGYRVGYVSTPRIYHKIDDYSVSDAKPLGRYYYVRNMLYTVKRLKNTERGSVNMTKAFLFCVASCIHVALARPVIGFASFCGIIDFLLYKKGRCRRMFERLFELSATGIPE